MLGWLLIEAFGAAHVLLLWAARITLAFVASLLVATAREWQCDIAQRAERWQPACPSNIRRPSVASPPAVGPDTASARRALYQRLATAIHDAPLDESSGPSTQLSNERASTLPKNWDHLKVSLPAFLWLRMFVWFPLVFHFLFGTSISFKHSGRSRGVLLYLTENFLAARGLWPWPQRKFAYSRIFANLLLNTGLAMFITPESILGGGGEFEARPRPRTVTFCMPAAANVVATAASGVGIEVKTLCAEVDIDGECLLSATFGGEPLSPEDAFSCLWLNILTYSHTQVHGFGNFAVNPAARDAYVRRMSIITIGYNRLGGHGFAAVMEILNALGVLRVPVSYEAIVALNTERSGSQSIPPHRHLHALAASVPYINFIVCVRKFFLLEFLNYQSDFPGIDGEALFIGTVLHSTEHGNAEYFVDEMALTAKGQFGAAFETAVMSRFLTTPLVVGRGLVDCTFKNAAHPFYRRVYAYAAGIDERLADLMEAAIIR